MRLSSPSSAPDTTPVGSGTFSPSLAATSREEPKTVVSPSGRGLRILYVQPPTKAFAGVERVVDAIATELERSFRDSVEVDVLYTSEHKNHDQAASRYTVVRRIAASRWSLMAAYRGTLQAGRYDVVVVPQIELAVVFWLSGLGLPRRVIPHLHGNPQRERSHWKAKVLFFLMRHVVLGRVPAIFGTSPRQLRFFNEMFQSTVPTFWVPNPVRSFDGARMSRPCDGVITYVNVGRLDQQKGQDLLVEAFAAVHAKRPETRLKLVGYGHDEQALRAQIDRHGLGAAVAIEYHPDNPEIALATSDIYVSSSRWEGWSLAICEALRFGLPVIATDCDFGPSDIITNPRLGHLVPNADVAALADAMMLYADTLEAEREHADFRRAYIDRYSVDRVVETHLAAIREACKA